ncbi:Crp/Fnr family transcriptional regulator [Mucilaginibacter polytrichastri]|uniref:Cyclic nucleotide-binding domain-containing protein n=1 Tax=Mucilaginibacter polytrichastri TaxID=1302689 RepID=A0A1Q6A292_9SPHI|nr:cyclic nucleotide-binding domain-containing protein [Mucilaginibacter polytrichastri]OKS88130.1 hypothetical protein RG47T_3594 [Mucilaginibacter polytrichastri]SFT09395.1 Cyclic nucleotide-binding domain-containing protein [Mucilaginibacter polytrichastri]
MTELEQYIKSYFGVVESNDLDTIVSFFKVTTIKKGDFLLRSGNRCNGLSFVHSGILRMFASTATKEVTQWISTKGYFTGDLSSFIFETPAHLSIQALADAEISTISKYNYNRLGDLLPKWHEFEKLFIARGFITMEQRIFSHLSMTAEERYQAFLNKTLPFLTRCLYNTLLPCWE